MSLESALQSFSTQPLLIAARSLFKDTLKIPLSPLADSPITPQRFFRDAYKPERHDGIDNLYLVGRITDDSFHAATQAPADLDTVVAQAAAEDYNGMFLIAADLGSRELTRSDLAARTRDINRTFSAPRHRRLQAHHRQAARPLHRRRQPPPSQARQRQGRAWQGLHDP